MKLKNFIRRWMRGDTQVSSYKNSLTLIWNDLCLGEQRIGTHTIYFFMLISPARGRKRTGPGRPAVLKDGKPGEGVGLFDDESL